ncbi:MAG: transcription termination factor NusA [Candidatus Makaraimicrobium thalassicum]|nr:MAG: transcription termination factor NusA [Candidatus Omnitrophota bacterium]
MSVELLVALERIEREKGISKEILFEAIESALASAARKVIDDPDISKEDITVSINKETGKIQVFSEDEEVRSERFGRIAAQTAKQVIIQKIREAERDVIFAKYLTKIGTIINGSVHRFEKGNIIVELDDAEAVLPRSEQLPRERFRQGEGIRAYLLRVDRGAGGPEIVLSRTDEGFVKKLFELEVPEISQGIVDIKGVAREAGERTKIAVCSKDEKVDPVGACVGMRGSRVRDIVKELHGERIDIIRWNDDIREYLPAALSPAEISRMVIDRNNNRITVTVPRDQLSLLIGKKGRNIRLASKLVEWELVADSVKEEKARDISLSEIPGIGKKTLGTLREAGYDTVEKLHESSVEALLELKGIGGKTAEKIITACKAVLTAGKEDEAAAEEKETEAENAG